MRRRCPDSKYLGTAVLYGYKFVYDGYAEVRSGAVANVVPTEGERVIGAVYEVSDVDIRKLDIFEEVSKGTYYRTDLPVKMQTSGEEVTAKVYLRNPQPVGEPSAEYVAVITEGKRDCAIVEKIKA